MKTQQIKQIEKRTGEILRQYTTFQGHLLNYIQQFHAYDLLIMCKKIYDIKQKTFNNGKIDWMDYEYECTFYVKTKNYRIEQLKHPEDFCRNEQIDFNSLYQEIWPIISKPFKFLKKEENVIYEWYIANSFRTKNIDPIPFSDKEVFIKLLNKSFPDDLCLCV